MKVEIIPSPVDDNEFFAQVTMTDDEWISFLTYDDGLVRHELTRKLRKGGVKL